LSLASVWFRTRWWKCQMRISTSHGRVKREAKTLSFQGDAIFCQEARLNKPWSQKERSWNSKLSPWHGFLPRFH